MWHDVRFALRTLRRNPGFAAVTVLTLALGIGAVTATFSLVNAVLLEALPYPSPAALVSIAGEMRREAAQPFPLSYLDIQTLAEERQLFEELSPVTGVRSFNLRAGDEVEHINGEMVGAEYFRILGVTTALGRIFSPEEARPDGAGRVVVLSHDLWSRRFGSSHDVIGTTVLLNELPYLVIGVAHPRFNGLTDEAQVWLPIGMSRAIYGEHYTDMRQFRWLTAVGRLRPGVSGDRAKAALDALAGRLQRELPAEYEHLGFQPTSLADAYVGDLRRPLLSLLAAAAFVLLIACTNIANLLLARATARRREISLRVALGAGGGRLARQLLCESLVLVAFGATAGLVLATWCTRLLVSSNAIDVPSFMTVDLDPTVLGATLAASLLSALLFGTAPALMAARVPPAEGFGDGGKGATGGRRRRRLQRGFVAAEVALALALLTGAGLMAKGFHRFVRSDLGFMPDSLLTLRVDLTADRYRENERVFTLVRRLLDEARAIHGVAAAAVEGPGYPSGGWYEAHFTREVTTGADADRVPARRHHVSPGYFAAMGVRLLAGRDFGTDDISGAARTIVVSERMARRAWPGENAVGKRLRTEGTAPVLLTVVGVVADVEHAGLQAADTKPGDVYLSVYQSPPRSPSLLTLLVRTSGSSAQLVPALRGALGTIDPNLPLYDVRTMRARLDEQTRTGRLLVTLMAAFSALGLVLAIVGVYGAVAYSVAQRTREIGIRVALGAGRRDVLRLVVRQGVEPVAVGVVVGLAAVWYLQRFITALLHGVSPLDPVMLGGSCALLVAVAAVASWLPARRAARIDPVSTLRVD